PGLIRERIEQIAAANLPVRVHTGCDFHLHFENIQDALENPTRYTINHGAYLMAELPDSFLPPSIEEIFRQLIDAGMIPIVTHPERNSVLQHTPERLEGWIEQ